MDQMSAALARPGRALLLECASLAARHIPIRGRLLLVDSGLRREVAPGAPHQRPAEGGAGGGPPPPPLPERRPLPGRAGAGGAPPPTQPPPPPRPPRRPPGA